MTMGPGHGGYPPQQGPYAGPQSPFPGNQGFPPPGQFGYPLPRNQSPKKSKVPWIIGGIVAVILVVAGAGFFVLHRLSRSDQAGSGNAPSATVEKVWSTSDTKDNGVGVWTTAHTVVRVGSGGVTGYDLSNGKQLFTVAPPKPGLVPCSASPTLSPGGVGTIF